MATAASFNALPADIFEDIILPDLLSQHLHSLLIDLEPPTWHAFYVLPLVSPFFRDICQRIVSKMFGTKVRPPQNRLVNTDDVGDDDDDDDEEPGPSDLLDYAMSVSQHARRSSSKNTFHDYNMSTLMEHRSLIRVYICLSLGKMFLNVDVLLPLGASGGRVASVQRNPWDEDYEDEDDAPQEPGLFDEATMHRCYMPFNCAQKICDLIVPERLGLVVAQYMAQVLPLYQSLPILAKYALDLRFNVTRKYMFEMVNPLSSTTDPVDSPTGQDDYAEWTVQTLDCLGVIDEFIEHQIIAGKLVRSFWIYQGVPSEALKMTRILDALDDVVRADWGSKTNTSVVRKKAVTLILRWAT